MAKYIEMKGGEEGTRILLSLLIHEVNTLPMKFGSSSCLSSAQAREKLKTNHSNVSGRQMNFSSLLSDFFGKRIFMLRLL